MSEMPDASVKAAWRVAALALVVRLAFVVWASPRFPAAADGFYYDTLARRLATGSGYTWLWPDGAVTNVAHYPVGYPALLAAAYVAICARPFAGMFVNALFGSAMAYGVHRVAYAGPRARLAANGAALAVALHPALVPYTAAIMTEGVAASLLVLAVVLARGRFERAWLGWALAGATLGLATLVRPQSLALAPLLGLLAPSAPASWRMRAAAAIVVTSTTLLACAPWTARNCVAMHKCSLVSENGGWNLLIGAQATNGAWQAAVVPDECKAVWDEAAKDDCFGAAARRSIAGNPVAWLARGPAKLAATFDYFGGAPWYLHESNPSAFGATAKVRLGVLESVVSYAFLVIALVRTGLAAGPRRMLRVFLTVSGAILAAISMHGWVAYVALASGVLANGPRWLARAPLVVPFSAFLVLATAATHFVFFGAGRYGLVVVPFVTALAFVPRGSTSATS